MPASNNAAQPHNPLLGVILIASAVAAFACVDAMTKHLASAWNVPLVVAVRYIVNVLALAAIYLPGHGLAMLKTNRTGLVFVRGLCLSAASLFAGLALTRMPVAETISIIFLAPFVVMVLAIPLLGEKVTPAGWLAAVAGFCGVLLVARPGGGLDPLGVAFALGCAAVTVGYYLLSRILAKTESTMAMLFHTALIGAVLFGAYLPWSLKGPMPRALDLGLVRADRSCRRLLGIIFSRPRSAWRLHPCWRRSIICTCSGRAWSATSPSATFLRRSASPAWRWLSWPVSHPRLSPTGRRRRNGAGCPIRLKLTEKTIHANQIDHENSRPGT